MPENLNADQQPLARMNPLSRRRFLQSAALTGVSAVTPLSAVSAHASASTGSSAEQPGTSAGKQAGAQAESLPNPIIPNFSGQYGGGDIPAFQAPRRPMGKTGLQVSILGMGGFHLGTVPTQKEVTEMAAKALDHGINFFDN